MNRWRTRHPQHVAKAAKDSKLDIGDDTDTEVESKADDLYSIAAAHRSTVIAKDKAAKARRRKGGRRG